MYKKINMRISKATTGKTLKPFLDDNVLCIQTLQSDHKITSFDCLHKPSQKRKVFKVVKQEILKTWVEMENWLSKL